MKNKKKILLIVIPIVVVLIIAVVIAVLYFTTDLFKSNKDLFWKYFGQNEDVISILENNKYSAQEQFKQSNSYTSSGNLSVVVEQGENSSKQFNVVTTSRHDSASGRTYADATLKNGDIDLLQVAYINSDDIYAIKCDDVFANYVGIKNSGLTELAASYGIENADNIPESINISEYANSLKITDEQKQHIIDTYLPVITNNILDTQYSKATEQIQVEGITYDANVYEVELSGANVKQIIIDCLSTIKADTETLVLISNKLSTLGFGIEYTDITNLTAKIDELINQIQQATLEDNLNIYVYENNKETIRTVIEMENVADITYDRTNNNATLSVDITQTNNANEGIINTENANDISTNSDNISANDIGTNIDGINSNEIQTTNETQNTVETINLDSQGTESTNTSTSRIIINKNINDNLTTNNIQLIPDINNLDSNINIEYSLSNVQNDNISNSYTITLSNMNVENKEAITITYDNSIMRADQVEEIEELTNSNTAIANNYSPQEFSTFMTNWMAIFSQVLTEKLSIIGFNM